MKSKSLSTVIMTILLTVASFFAPQAGGERDTIDAASDVAPSPGSDAGLLGLQGRSMEFDPLNPLPLDHGRFERTVDDLSILKNPMAGFRYLTFSPLGPSASALKDENDAPSNATELFDGDSLSDNVTSWISGTTIHTSDIDYYYVNLTAAGTTNTVDKMTVTIDSQDGVGKKAHLITQCLLPNPLLNQFDVASFEVTGALHGSRSVIEITPEGDPSVDVTIPYFLLFYSFNSTSINYSVSIDISSTTRTEWNGLFGSGMLVNATNQPARMQSVQANDDLYDWFDLTPLIEESLFDADRGDNVEMTVRVDIATEERGSMLGYAGNAVWNTPLLTSCINWIYFIYYNYTAQQLNIVLIQNAIPFAAVLFGSDPVTVGFKGQVDHAWLGLHPEHLWIFQNRGYLGAEGTSRMQYNLTNIQFKLLPPNDPPTKTQNIPSFTYDEDMGPWLKVVDLERYFYDKESQGSLRFVVKDADTKNSAYLKAYVDDDRRHLNIETLENNWNGRNTYTVRCYDNGTDLLRDSIDDRWIDSNTFTVTVTAVNDPAYIKQVDLTAGAPKINDHTPITYLMQQGTPLMDRRIYAYDNDTEDSDSIVYSHNATTTAFTIKQSSGMFSFIPTNDDVGVTWVGVYVDDGHPPTEDDYCLLRFEVLNRNDPPTLVHLEWRDADREFDLKEELEPILRGVREDQEINLTITASDPDISIGLSDSLTWSSSSDGWEVHRHPYDPQKAYLTYLPDNDDAIAGTAQTELYVMDSNNARSTKVLVTLNIDNVNDRPVILSVNDETPLKGKVTLNTANGKQAFEDRPFLIIVEAQEVDPRDSLTFKADSSLFSLVRDPINEFRTNFTFTPTQDMIGPGSVLITVTDESGERDSVRVDYEVVNTNDPPERPGFDYDQFNLFANYEINFTAKDNGDPEGDNLTFLWDFGDGTELVEGKLVKHTFRRAAVYLVKVTAKDTGGLTTSFERSISIFEEIPVVDPNKDTDGDGIPDTWEDNNGLNKYVQDSNVDSDKDGFTNIEEYEAKTLPLDPSSHPERQDKGSSGLDPILLIVIIAAVVIIIAALLFVFLVVLRPAKPALPPPPYYGAQYPAVPGAQQPMGLPGQTTQQMPPVQRPQMLPPASPPPPPKEDDVLKEYVDEAQREMREEASGQIEADKNVWRPPAGDAQEERHSQVDDLFDDAGKKEKDDDGSVPELPPMPEL